MDMKNVVDADLVVAFLGKELSGGVHIELGWATSLKKRVVIFQKEGCKIPPLTKGLRYLPKVSLIKYQDDETLFSELARVNDSYL